MPGPPGEIVLLGKALRGNLVPKEAPVRTDLDTFGPPAATAVGPAFDCDQPAVDDRLFRPRFHDGAAHGHFLDLYAAGVELVVLADLACWNTDTLVTDWTGAGEGSRSAFARCNHFTRNGAPMYPSTTARRGNPWIFRKRPAIHLPCKEDLVGFDL